MKKLKLERETIRMLSNLELRRVNGAEINDTVPHSRAACTTAATDGNNGCVSEASGCASICENSCPNMSCWLGPVQ